MKMFFHYDSKAKEIASSDHTGLGSEFDPWHILCNITNKKQQKRFGFIVGICLMESPYVLLLTVVACLNFDLELFFFPNPLLRSLEHSHR